MRMCRKVCVCVYVRDVCGRCVYDYVYAKCLSSAVLPSTFLGSHVLQSQLRESDRKARVARGREREYRGRGEWGEVSEEGVSAQANQISSILKRPFVAGNRAAASAQGVGKND